WRQLLAASHRPGPAILAPLGQSYLATLLADGERAAARDLWGELRDKSLMAAYEGPSSNNDAITDGGFEHLDSPSPLAWQTCTDCGPRVLRQALESPARSGALTFPRALAIEFSGVEPANVQL